MKQPYDTWLSNTATIDDYYRSEHLDEIEQRREQRDERMLDEEMERWREERDDDTTSD